MLSLTEDRVEVWLRRYLIDALRQTAKNNFIRTFIMRQHGPLKFYYKSNNYPNRNQEFRNPLLYSMFYNLKFKSVQMYLD